MVFPLERWSQFRASGPLKSCSRCSGVLTSAFSVLPNGPTAAALVHFPVLCPSEWCSRFNADLISAFSVLPNGARSSSAFS
eukprot:7271285-Pyramimonas_sp.AAC.1